MVKDKCGQSGLGTLKLTYLKNELIEWTDFVHADANSEKLKVDSMILWVDVVKNGHGRLLHETLKSAVS